MTSHAFTYTNEEGRNIRVMGHARCKDCQQPLWRIPYPDGTRGSIASHPGDESAGVLCKECAPHISKDTVKAAFEKLNKEGLDQIGENGE